MDDIRVVDDVAKAALELFLDARPKTVLLTGGDTPRRLYELLAKADYDWSEVEFFFSDERCVPESDERSNLRMAEEALLSKVPARVYPMDGANCEGAGYERALRDRFADRPWFDLALYGMGPDGHTASLYPGRPEVEFTEPWVVNVPEAQWEPYVPRITLTVPVLSAATLGLLLIDGEGKRGAFSRFVRGDDIPSRLMKPERLIVLVDPAAAGTVAG